MRSVNLGRWSRRIERYFNIKGGGGLMDVEQSVRATLSLFSGVEDKYLEGWGRFAGAVQVTGGAAQFAQVQLRNPSASNIIVGVEKLTISNLTSAATAFGIGQGPKNTDLASISAAPFRLDTRSQPLPASILSFTTNGVNPSTTQIQVTIPAIATMYDVVQTVDQELTLMPGDALLIFSQNTAQIQSTSIVWRERALELSELT